jgi:23S rRNA (uracil1939-C5)-methyltransferase
VSETVRKLAALDELEVTIEKLIAGGDGLARCDGVPVFVPRSAPGDRLRVRIVERRPDYGRAEILEVLAPGPGRRTPPCPVFDRCGGCDLQHLDDALQTQLKAEAVLETLRRLGSIERPPRLEVFAGAPFGYRLRTQLQVAAGDGTARVGYFARGSHDLVETERCAVLVPELEQWLTRLPVALAGSAVKRLDVAAGDDGVTFAPAVADLPHGEVAVAFDGLSLSFDARCFFQGHRGLLGTLVERAVGAETGQTAFDLYCGVGLFALPLARRYAKVVGVESDAVAVRHARNNARRNRIANLEIVARSMEAWIRSLPHGADRVLVDPPRSGMSLVTRRVLLDRRPARLSYVSCHPAAMARDLADLSSGFQLESLDLIDLFPQTGHLEVVAQLRAGGGGR